MLALGSDVFYNINSVAAGMNIETEEETKELQNDEMPNRKNTAVSSMTLQSELINPYGLKASMGSGLVQEQDNKTSSGEELICLFGNPMDNEAYDKMMKHLGSYVTAAAVSSTTAAKAGKSTGATESFSVEETISSSVVKITKEEVRMLERIVEAEASSEDMVGKILIANVIFNRMADEEFPDTVEDVIFHKVNGDYQFSPISDERYWEVEVTDETEEAVLRALEGEDYSEGALYFIARKRTTSSSARWFDDNLDWLFKHGGHEFYKNN
jgi:N-acetylmuramoyl-L-alanine amidase